MAPPANDTGFHPPWWLKNPKAQSMLCSFRPGVARNNPLAVPGGAMILQVEGRVRLLGFLSRQTDRPAKGLVILLHGWEGSAASTYMLSTGRTLYRAGYDVFRLNLRDHGDTHHLNRGIFRASKLGEVHEAVTKAAALADGRPVFMAGFSLGGNFVLRVARRAAMKPIPGLRLAAAVSPLINPAKTTAAIDTIRLFKFYFIRKWRRSLAKKQALFPERYDFRPVLAEKGIWAMSETMVRMFGQFGSLDRYFQTYTLTADQIRRIDVPLLIITAQDDPVIPFEDFRGLEDSASRSVITPAHGGHAGFIQGIPWSPWYEDRLVSVFDARL
jgi:predicted alpha/beta-fold hydrolase